MNRLTVPHQRKLTLLTSSISRANGGLFDAVRNLAFAIKAERRYSPSVIGLRDAETDCDHALWDGIETTAFAVRGPHAFGYAPGLADTLTRTDPDLLHVHGLWMYPSVAATRWSHRSKPYVVSPHGMLDPWALGNSRWKKRISAAIYENRHLRDASCLHALNVAEAEAMRAYGLKNPICVIPNGVELPEMTAPVSPRQVRTLFYLGRLHPKKGLLNLVNAWSLIHKEARANSWDLVIAGWDQLGHQAELEELAMHLKVTSTLSFAGPLFGKAKADRFMSASAFILPSLSEGLPMTVLEAWSWGIPVLITPECNLPEGAAAGAAIMMEPNVDSISAALRQLFSKTDWELQRMGMNGRSLVRERFQWPRIAQKMSDVYDWVLGAGPTPSCLLN